MTKWMAGLVSLALVLWAAPSLAQDKAKDKPATVGGTKIKADYRGRPYGDKIKGMIDYELGDNSGEIEFTGNRKS